MMVPSVAASLTLQDDDFERTDSMERRQISDVFCSRALSATFC